MANAVAANQLTDAYTLIREGLMQQGGEEFVNAMIALNPKRASWDFLDYLAQASAEELRQLTLSSVDLFSCVAILKHLSQLLLITGNLMNNVSKGYIKGVNLLKHVNKVRIL